MKLAHGLTVVALPAPDEAVWKISSEKVPHMTLLFLGTPDVEPGQLGEMAQYVQHASSFITRFGMAVDRRGPLGSDEADVLFFEKSFSWTMMEKFRSNLLANDDISKAYLDVPQFPQWTPHLTLGYPTAPAKKPVGGDQEYGLRWVNFDRIALWTDDFDGPTFQLKSFDHQEVAAMSDLEQLGANFLEHYGVKGMKWGKRKAAMSPTDVTTVHKGRRLKAQGGQGHTPHEDAKTAITARQIATKSGKHALSNKDLQAAVNRMNLEQQFDRLNPNRRKKGQAFIKSLLGAGKTANELVSFSNSPAGQQIRSQFS